jgi:hypothetical protein
MRLRSRSPRSLPQRALPLQRVALRGRILLPGRILAAALLMAGAVILAGCTVGSLGDNLPAAAGGLPENTPARPATPAAYPAVHDAPPPRADMLTDEEQKKLEADLVAARNRAAAGNPAGGARKP